ncbi:MAG: ABC-2 family transporter protein, partial [Oscillospiraceae bacterium]|nr:ABC-2 family transporter protein [Oscillospiraceae bacterium]
MKELKFYAKSIRLHLLSEVEYRGWWISVLQVLVVVVTDPIGTVFMFSRFGSIGSWTMERILLIYAMAVTSYGLAEGFCRGLDYPHFPNKMIRSGGFDRLLLRPRSLFTQAAISHFNIHRFARPAAGIGIILWCLSRQNVTPDLHSFLLLSSALLGGTLVYMGVFVFTSGIAFFTVKALD